MPCPHALRVSRVHLVPRAMGVFPSLAWCPPLPPHPRPHLPTLLAYPLPAPRGGGGSTMPGCRALGDSQLLAPPLHRLRSSSLSGWFLSLSPPFMTHPRSPFLFPSRLCPLSSTSSFPISPHFPSFPSSVLSFPSLFLLFAPAFLTASPPLSLLPSPPLLSA